MSAYRGYRSCTGSVICRCRICKPATLMFGLCLLVGISAAVALVLTW